MHNKINLNSLFLFLVFTFSCFVSCSGPTSNKQETNTSSQENTTLALEMGASMLDTIPNEAAVALWNNYNSFAQANNFGNDTANYVNNVWFSLNSLESFITFAKSEAAKSNKSVSGLRFYFGKYGATGAISNNKVTLFISPTKLNGNEANRNDPDMQIGVVQNYGNAGEPKKKQFPY
jgi:hypothetical protein